MNRAYMPFSSWQYEERIVGLPLGVVLSWG